MAEAHRKLDAEYERLGEDLELADQQARVLGIEGGVSAADLLAYQIGWGRQLLSWDREEQAGGSPTLPAEGFRWNQLGELARRFYDEKATSGIDDLRSEFRSVVNDLSSWIETLSEAELFEIGQRDWAQDRWPIVKWIQVNTIAPYGSARTKLRRWLRESGL